MQQHQGIKKVLQVSKPLQEVAGITATMHYRHGLKELPEERGGGGCAIDAICMLSGIRRPCGKAPQRLLQKSVRLGRTLAPAGAHRSLEIRRAFLFKGSGGLRLHGRRESVTYPRYLPSSSASTSKTKGQQVTRPPSEG